MSWEENIIENLKIKIIDGDRGVNYPKSTDFLTEGYCLFLNTGNVTKEGINFDNTSFISENKDSILRKGKTQRGDIILTTRGTLGNVAFYDDNISYDNIRINSGMVIIRPDSEEYSSKFLYYVIKSDNFQKQISNSKSGSAQPQIPIGTLKKLSIQKPPLETQKRIASILATYDDLIENNLKRIKLLEETAQNIYKEWFVNFRFPNYEHTEFDGESSLPVGWEKKTIDAFAEVITGKTPSTTNSNFYGGNIPFVKTPDMHDAPYVLSTSIYLSNEGAESQNNKFLPKNSVMVSCIGTAGVVALASTNCQTNQQINSVRFDEEFKAFYFYCFARGLKTLLEGLGSNGATMVNVNKSKFEKIELIVPDSETLKRHYGLVKVIFDQILTLQEKNEKLKEARDILLPRLMNRTIEV